MIAGGFASAGAAVLIAFGAVATSEPTDAPSVVSDVEKVCAERACRVGGYEAVVFTDAQHYTTVPVTHSPYILDDGGVLVFPGETVAVQFSVVDGKLGRPISAQRYYPHLPALIVKSGGSPEPNSDDAALPVVKAEMPAAEVAKLPANTFLISYGQFKQTGEQGMVLVIEHNLPQTIKLDAIVAEITAGAYRQHYTSTCPLMPKMWGNENWPNALGPIVLKNFRFLSEGPNFNCE